MSEAQQVFPDSQPPQGEEVRRAEIHLSEYWAVVVKRRRIIALIVFLVLAATVARTLLTPPTYKATTVVNVQKEATTPYDVGDSRAVYQSWDPEFIPTQTRLMQSREVAERAVDRLNLLAEPTFNQNSGKKLGAADQATARTRVAMRVQGGVAVAPVRGTNLVQLSYTGLNPKISADVANAVADAYIDWTLETKYKIVGQANKFLTAQAEQLRSEIEGLERQLQAYGRQKDIVSMDPETNSTLQNLGALNQDYSSAVADRVAKEARYYELQNARADAATDTLSGGLVTQLRSEQARLEREYAEKLNLYKPEWPAMQQLKAQIDKARQNLNEVMRETISKARENARNEYMTARRREESLKGVLQGQKSAALTQSSNAVEYNNLKIEIDSKKQMMSALLNRQAETEVASRLSGERVSSTRVVDRALPPTFRFRPSYRRNGMLGLFLGFALALGLAFFLEYLDRSLRTPSQVEQYLGVPALGVIPTVGSRGMGYGYAYAYSYLRRRRKAKSQNPENKDDIDIDLIPHTHPRSTVAEAYRAFRAALLLSRAGGIRSLVITSSLPGEGKSATACNLAVVLGQMGKKVLLVDADLHKPRLHKVFNVSNRVGLVSILAQNLDPLTAFAKTHIPNLFLMPSGPPSPNPSGLLASTAMTEFLDVATSNFSYVVLDTPPLGPVADAIVIGHQTDGVVITTQAGRTPRDVVRRVRDKLLLSNVRVLGALINNLSEDPLTYAQYYKYYGEEYGTNTYAEPLPTKAAKA